MKTRAKSDFLKINNLSIEAVGNNSGFSRDFKKFVIRLEGIIANEIKAFKENNEKII